MPSNDQVSIQHPAMHEKVRNWLDAQGFSLEMRAASSFREAGFEVQQSSLYRDPQEGKLRETDVIAIHPDFLGMLSIWFVVECKSSSKPWVLLCSEHVLKGYNRLFSFALSSKETKAPIIERIQYFINNYPWLQKDGPIGYSLRQAFSENDVAYGAALSVAKATHHLVHGAEKYVAPLRIGFPIIVVDSPILLCSLTEDGQIQLEERDQGEVLFNADLPIGFGACIRVVNIKALPAFVTEAKGVADRLRADLRSAVKEAWEAQFPGSTCLDLEQ
jgi:hypothetical protein